jgi:2-keto-3-deoxy-L-rhamnonate aldolase RhmA
MKASRAALVAAACLLACLVVVKPERLQGQAGGHGQAGPGHGPNGAPGKATPTPVDAGRPWGWAVRAFMDDPTQPLYNTTKQKLLEGKQVFSQTITSFDVKAYCDGAAKYDFSRFEMQHATLRFDEIEKMIAACPRVSATPIIRIPDATETNVQRAVDVGGLGIIVPTVDDAIESRSAAMFARFPPIGRRSTGGGQAGSIWTPVIQKPRTFRSTINDNMLVIVMIETQEGVKNALEIASQPGVDVVIIGNADFESFSGFAPTSEGYLDLQTRVRNATYLAGKFWGNANAGFSRNNPIAADSRFHLGVPPTK